MRNVIEIDKEKAVVSFDSDTGMFRGEFIGLNGGADFYADSVVSLFAEGSKSLAVFKEVCREKGLEPRRNFSGKFNVRLDPSAHEAAVLAAAAEGKSLNDWISETIKEAAAA